MTLERLEASNSEKNERTRNEVNLQTILHDEAAFSSARNLTKVSVLMCNADIEDFGNRSGPFHC